MTGEGREELGRYFEPYVRVAADRGVTAVFDTSHLARQRRLGREARLHPRLPNVTVVGGCCGTDYRHIAAIADAWLAV